MNKKVFLSVVLLSTLHSTYLAASHNMDSLFENCFISSSKSAPISGPRIEGRLVDWLHKDASNLFVSVGLNMTDELARQANQNKSQPIMLSEVKRIDKHDEGMSPYAVLLESGSHIEFAIKSTGPYGFGYKITTGAEEIAKALYKVKTTESLDFATSHLRRYQDKPKTLRVDDFGTMGVSDGRVKNQYMFCNIESWAVYDYTKNGQDYGKGPKYESASYVQFSAKGGGLHEGTDSDSKFGSITNINKTVATDHDGIPLRRDTLRLMFLVFASAQEKHDFYHHYQDLKVDDF